MMLKILKSLLKKSSFLYAFFLNGSTYFSDHYHNIVKTLMKLRTDIVQLNGFLSWKISNNVTCRLDRFMFNTWRIHVSKTTLKKVKTGHNIIRKGSSQKFKDFEGRRTSSRRTLPIPCSFQSLKESSKSIPAYVLVKHRLWVRAKHWCSTQLKVKKIQLN